MWNNLDEVEESIVIGQQWKQDERVVLFVKLRHGLQAGRRAARADLPAIKRHCTARHVPAASCRWMPSPHQVRQR